MARKTNKELVLTLAAELGVEVEYGQMGSEGFEVALYGHASHMAFDPMGEGHTAITNQSSTGIRTEAGIWGAALRDLREFVPCAADCHCRAFEPTPDPVRMPFIIVDSNTDAEYVGTAISAATPAETMQAMIAQSFGVSRETVRIWETDNYREYGFDTPRLYGRPARQGTARFTDPAPNPYRPAPVTLTHSNHRRNS